MSSTEKDVGGCHDFTQRLLPLETTSHSLIPCPQWVLLTNYPSWPRKISTLSCLHPWVPSGSCVSVRTLSVQVKESQLQPAHIKQNPLALGVPPTFRHGWIQGHNYAIKIPTSSISSGLTFPLCWLCSESSLFLCGRKIITSTRFKSYQLSNSSKEREWTFTQ